jgi:hypothetical protein
MHQHASPPKPEFFAETSHEQDSDAGTHNAHGGRTLPEEPYWLFGCGHRRSSMTLDVDPLSSAQAEAGTPSSAMSKRRRVARTLNNSSTMGVL